MKEEIFVISLGEIEVSFKPIFKETGNIYKNYIISETSDQEPSRDIINITDDDCCYYSKLGIERTAENEANLFTALASDHLLNYNRCILHGAAIRFHGKAWILLGPSGVGKSTQAKNLRKIWTRNTPVEDEEFSIICGDRPVLALTHDGHMMVHPSCWNGKEGWYGAPASLLEGIICLERGAENIVVKYKPKNVVVPVLQSMIYSGKSVDLIKKAAEFENNLLKSCELWGLTAASIPDSSELLYNTIFSYRS